MQECKSSHSSGGDVLGRSNSLGQSFQIFSFCNGLKSILTNVEPFIIQVSRVTLPQKIGNWNFNGVISDQGNMLVEILASADMNTVGMESPFVKFPFQTRTTVFYVRFTFIGGQINADCFAE